MGYELHVTRAEFWAENEDHQISIDEWLALIDSDPSLILHEDAGPVSARLAGDLDSGGWIDWDDGNLNAKVPHPEVFAKLLEIAAALDARIQGDDGEGYERLDDYPGRINPSTGVAGRIEDLPLIFRRKRYMRWIEVGLILLAIAAMNLFGLW